MTPAKSKSSHAVDSRSLPWIPIRTGLSFKPLRFFPDHRGYALLLRVEPGTVVPRHRHTGEVHGFHLEGRRKLLDTGEVVEPGGYVYEPAGNVDSWMAVGDQAVVAHFTVTGAVEYLDEHDQVVDRATPKTAYERYRRYCEDNRIDFVELAA
jgi:2,4'-dihydroxyacetophenone dioxygenase